MKNIFLSGLLGLFLAGAIALPAISSAQEASTDTVALQAQIQSLLRQISDLQAQLGAPQRTPVEIQPAQIARDLRVGDRGEDVRTLQKVLRNEGDFTYPENTGYFGPVTREAVVKFQTRNNISPTGSIDSQTRSKVAAILASYPGSGVTTATVHSSLIRNYSLTPVPESNKAFIEWSLTEEARATVYATCSVETRLLITSTGTEVGCPQKGDLILTQQTGTSGQVVFTPIDDSKSFYVSTTMIATNQNGNDKAGWGVSFPIVGEPTSSINVTSPAGAPGGQDLIPGTTFPIQWKSQGVENISLEVCTLTKDCISITVPGQGVPASSGEYAWFVDPNHPLFPGSNLRIKASDTNNSNVVGFSGYFDVASTSDDPDLFQKTADLNGDGNVGVPDLLILLAAWGPCGGECPEDLNQDGMVNDLDMTILLEAWGPVKN